MRSHPADRSHVAFHPPYELPTSAFEHGPERAYTEVWSAFRGTRGVRQRGVRSIDLTQPFQLSAWVWFGAGGHEPVFQWASTMRELLLRRHANGRVQLLARDGDETSYIWVPGPAKTWLHVVAQWHAGTLALYIDGECVGRQTAPFDRLQTLARAGALHVGAMATNDRDYLRGGITEVAIEATLASDDEVAQRSAANRDRFRDAPPDDLYERGRVSFEELYPITLGTPVDYDANLRAAYQVFLQPGDIAIDVGAHVGKHTLPMARAVGDAGYIYAFEPLPDAFAGLQENLEREGITWVEAHHVAVADKPADEVEFFRVTNRLGQSSFKRRNEYRKAEWTPVRTTARVVTLDDVYQREGRLRFIKTDVEGAESLVFAGATTIIDRHRPVIHFEFETASHSVFDVNPSEMYQFFADRDYRLFDILGHRLPTLSLFLASDRAEGVFDYIAVPAEEPLVDAMRARLIDGWM